MRILLGILLFQNQTIQISIKTILVKKIVRKKIFSTHLLLLRILYQILHSFIFSQKKIWIFMIFFLFLTTLIFFFDLTQNLSILIRLDVIFAYHFDHLSKLHYQIKFFLVIFLFHFNLLIQTLCFQVNAFRINLKKFKFSFEIFKVILFFVFVFYFL